MHEHNESGLPHIADMERASRHVADGPKAEVALVLLDDLVGGGEKRWRHGEAERLGGLEVQDRLELSR